MYGVRDFAAIIKPAKRRILAVAVRKSARSSERADRRADDDGADCSQ